MKITNKVISTVILISAIFMATNATAKEPIVEVKTDYGVIKIKLYNETPSIATIF